MIIRTEMVVDQPAIHALTKQAFEPMSYSDGSEADAIDTLRNDGNLTLSLVAVDGGEIIGHVAFSPVSAGGDNKGWFGLGPVAVAIERQRTGVGSALIDEGLSLLKSAGAKGCVLIGDPLYYGRFGFVSDGSVTYLDTPVQYVQWLAFLGDRPEGDLKFSAGLQG